MKTMLKSIFSLFLVILCISTVLPTSAFIVETKKPIEFTFPTTSNNDLAKPVENTYNEPTEKVEDENVNEVVAKNGQAELLIQAATPDMITYGNEDGWPIMEETGEAINFKWKGSFHWNGWRWTYYTSKQLYHYRTKEWYACDDGIYRTADGYIVVASQHHEKGDIIDTPFGKGMVLDWCGTEGTIDIYTHY